MRTDTEPADTRIMGIVHGALRRDLERIRSLVATRPYPDGRQRQALGEHVVWLMDFLHAHHTSEDSGLWPLVRRRNPATGALLDSLEADHALIDPAATGLTAAGRRYAASTREEDREDLVVALDRLAEVLFPHLDREVSEAMPVVAATISRADWQAVEQRYNIEPKSVAQLAMEGHWLLDGIDAEGYDVVVNTVSPVKRFVLLHGFAWAYRRRARARWEPDPSTRAVAAAS